MKSPILTFTCAIALMFGLTTAASAQLVPTQEYELTGFPTLQSYYPLEKNSNDESTNGFHFNDSIATLTVGKHNTDSSAYDFLFNNGILYNYGGLNWLQNGEFTVNLWIQNNDTVYYNAVTLLYQGDTVADMWFGIEDGRFSFSRTGAVETDVWKSVDSLQLNQWHMLTANIKVDTSVHVQLFIDGVETDTTHATTYDFYHQMMPLNHLAGAYDMYGMNTFNGKIDDIKVFNQQLTPTQISDMYNYESVAQRNLTLWVDMSYQELIGNFNPGADVAYVSGSFNAWGMTPLTDMGGGIFETTISNQNISDTIYFNFGYSNNDGEYYEDLGGTDRMWVVKDLNNALDYVYNNEWYDTNMALVSIDEPQSLSNAASDTVRVMVQNRGFNTLTDFVLSYDIDAGIPVIDTVNLTLNPGEYYNHTFSVPADFSLSGTYTLNTSVSVLSDENSSDDMLSKVIQNTATTGINFFVDMTYQIGVGNFDPAFDSLDVSGTFNGWSSPGNWLTDANNDSVYEVYINGLNTLEAIEYKFRFNGDWSQPHEFPGGDNRMHYVDKLNDTLYHVFNDEDYYNNLGVLYVSSPSAMSSGAAEVVEVMLQNRGFADVDTFDISYILDGAAPVTENVVTNIPFGDEWSYAFTNTIDVSTEGVHTLKIYTSLPGDEDTADDTVLFFINNLPQAAALPYTETFDSASSTWSIGGVNSSWERGIPTKTTFSSDKFSSQAMVTSLNSSIGVNEQSYVVSPVFQGPFTNVAVEFSYMVESNWQAGAAIQYSTDGGNTWMRLADNWTIFNGNTDDVWALDWSGDQAGFIGYQPFWKDVIYPLGDLGGATEVIFRVAFGSEQSLDGTFDGFAFDNFKFFEKPEKDVKLRVVNVEHDLNQDGDEWVSFMAHNTGASSLDSWKVEAHLDNGEVFTNNFIDYYISPETEVWEGIGINVSNLTNGPYNVTLVIFADTSAGAYSDTLVVKGVKSPEITGFPFVDDFESTQQWSFINEDSPYMGWIGIETPLGDAISSAYSGSQALTTSNQNQGGFRTTLAAVSPWFKFDTLLRPTLNFAVLRELMNKQALGLQYRTRSSDWQQLGFNDGLDWYNTYLDESYSIYWSNQNEAWTNIADTNWMMVEKAFDELAGMQEVQFRFLYSAEDNWEKYDGFAIDDFTVFDNPYAYDLAVAELKSPKTGISQPGNDTVRVLLENRGANFITNVDIEYSIDTTYVTETITDTIFSGETYEYVFNQTADLSAVGQYYINVNLYVASDENSANDYLSEDINILPIISSLPYNQDFELGPGDWVISGEDYTYSWEYGTPAGEAINSAASGSYAFMTMLTGAYYDNEMSYVQSPFFDLSALTAPFVKLDFWSQTGDLDDGALLQYTTDNGNTWQTIGSQHSTPAWYNWTSDPAEGGLSTIGEYEYWTDNTNGWQTAMHPITELAGEPMVSFRVLFASDDSDNNYDGFAFDNFMVSDALLGYTDDFNDSILTNWNWESSYTLSETNGELKVTATDKIGWEAVNLTFEPLQLEENPYLSVKIKADSNVNVRFNYVDVNGTWTDRYNQGYEIIADGTYHNYMFDFSDKWVNYQNIPVHPNQIVEMTMQFNMSDYFNGEVYFDDLKIGADAVIDNNLDIVFVEITNDCNASTADSVKVHVANTGLNALTNFDLSVSADSNLTLTETITSTLNPGDTGVYLMSGTFDFYHNNYVNNYTVVGQVSHPADGNVVDNEVSFVHQQFGDYTDMQGWASYNTCDGLADNNVWAVVEDVNGDIWMSGFKGITRFDGTNFTQYYVEDGLAGNYSWTLEAASDGTVWMPASDGGFTSYKDGVFTEHYPLDSLAFEECSFEDDDGNVWFGSYSNNGVIMYDGTMWTHFPTEIGAIVEDIDHAPNGDLLFANQGSVIRYDGSTFSEFLINDTARYISEIFRDDSGITWFYGPNGLYSFNGSTFNNYSDNVADVGYIQAIEQDASGNIWFGGYSGAIKYDGTNWEYFPPGDGLIPSQVWSIQGSSNGNIWFGTRLGASVYTPTPLVNLFHRAQFIPRNTCADSMHYVEVQFVNTGLETLINPKAGFSVNNGTPVIETIADTLFNNDTVNYVFTQPANLYTTEYSQSFNVTTFASVDGDLVTENDTISRAINVFGDYEDKPGWESFNTCNGLIDVNVWSMIQDESGDIWATSFYGINRISEDSISTYTIEDGLADNYSWTSLAASDGSLWFPSVYGGFSIFNSGTFETIYPLDSLTFAECSFEDNQGNLWFGSYDGFGVAMYDGSSWAHYPTEISDIVVDIDQLPSGEMLFATFNGVVSYDGTSFGSYLVNGTDLIMNEIFTDSQGRTWFIGSGQAHMLDNGTWTEYTDNLSLIGYVESIDEDAFGSLWFGGSQGVMSFDGTTWKRYAPDNGLVPGPIYSVLGAQDGSVWFGSYQQGLSKFSNQVVAKFNFEVNDQTVEFFNQSFALSPVYNWNFGDGGQSQAANPVHTYTNPGYYDVCLTVFDEVTNRSHKLCQEIQVGDTAQVCKVEFDYTVSSDTVDFYDISSDTFTSFFWNFGDGQFSEEMNPRHIYDQGGYFDVILQAYDSTTSCYDEMMQTIYVESVDAENCLAGYDYIVSEGTVTFVNTSQGDYTDVLWSFGDGNYSVIKDTVVHTYTESDYYEVCVTVYDSATGCLDESCQEIQVSINEEQLCNADFSYFVDGNLVDFTSAGQGEITDYMWDFGDGNFAFEANPEHEYIQPGFYEVEFTVFDSATNCLDFKQKVVMVTEGAEAVCNAGFEFYVNNNNVVFNNTSTGDFTDIFWDFGDGMYATDTSPTHAYQNPDYYEVSLTVYDETTGCLDEFTDVVFVASETEPSCNALFSYQSNQNTVNFANNSIGAVTDYFWDFGDGNYSVEKSPQHVYGESGYFEVNLTIYNDTNNCLDEFTEVVFVYNPEVTYCNAKFSYYPQGSTISFTSEATGGFTQYFWDFDDGKNSNNLNPVHTYEEPGYYEVAFTVLDTANGCFDTRYKVIFVEGNGGTGTASSEIKAAYSYFPNSSNNQVTFTDESYGDVTNWYWNFGDNSTASYEQHPVYTYATNDYYRVCLTASNAERQKTKCKFIAVGDVSNSSTSFFNYFADSITSTAHFKNKSLGNIVAYQWNFGDGYTSDKKNPSHTYADTGYYAVCLTTISATDVEKTYCKDVRIGNAIDNPCLYSCVWPGDANNDLEANHYDVMTIGLNYGLQGPQREVANTNWYGQFAQNWSTYQLDGTNNKYGDCNGDGIINFDDIAAIEKNFAFSHYFQPDVKNAQWLIACEWVNEQSKASKRKAKAILSPPSSKSKSEIYAIAYEIEVVGGEKIIWNTIEVNFENSWIGQAGLDMFTVFQTDSTENMIFIGMTRIDQQNISGSGEIAELTFEFKDGVQPNGVSFNVTTKGGIESTGESVTVDGSIALDLGEDLSACQGESVILDAGTGFDSYEWSTGATDTSRIEVFGAGAYYVTVTDSTGAEASDTILVNVYSLPNVDLGNDVEVNDSVILDAGSGFSTYLWSTGEQTENITVNETGEYWVEVSNENGCTSRDTVSVTIKTDINDKRTKEITVFPNPNNGKFWLVYEFNSTTPFVVEIINVDGSTVWRNEFDGRNGIKALIGDDSLSEGVYYLRLVHNNEANTIRFVVL